MFCEKNTNKEGWRRTFARRSLKLKGPASEETLPIDTVQKLKNDIENHTDSLPKEGNKSAISKGFSKEILV